MPHGPVMALDISGSNCGVAEGLIGCDPKLYSKKFMLDGDSSAFAGFGRAVAWMATRLQDDLCLIPTVIFVEQLIPAFQFAGRTNYDSAGVILPGLHGALIGVAAAKGIPVFSATVARVRTLILGRAHGYTGGAAKKMVLRACKERGWSPANTDESDAAAVWLWGCGEVEKGALDRGLQL
jgi:hypothetical protein